MSISELTTLNEVRPPIFPFSCIAHRPDSTVEYYEAYKNIGRKYALLKRYDLAKDVIQAGIDALPSAGGGLQLKGVFTVLSGLAIDRDYVKIIGEGRQRTLLDFSTAPAGSLFTLGNGTTRREAIELSDLSMKGRNSGAYAQTAINIYYCRRLRFANLEIYYFAGTDMYAVEGRMSDALIFDSSFWNNANNLMINGASSNTANKIIANYFFLSAGSTGYHIDVQAGSTLNRIIGNLFEGSQNRARIAANNNVFGLNSFEVNSGATDLNIAGSGHIVVGNNFTNTVTTTATASLLKHNVGYVTENSGTGTGNGAQQTIAHGCNFTPTYDQVFLSERATGGALARQTAAPDATNIYVTATNAKDYNWKVSQLP